jgi:hypothetical protein
MKPKNTQRDYFTFRSSTFHDKIFSENIEATKFYIRHRENYPETELQDYARRGFWTLGIETVPYEWVDDIDSFEDLSPSVGVAGYIGDIHRALNKLKVTIPQNIDYPDQLKHLLKRSVVRGTIGDVRKISYPVFIKPEIDHKLFTGFVWDAGEVSRRKIVTCPDEVFVWISEPINILTEYRTFILNDEILDCRHYKGDWRFMPDHKVIEDAVSLMKTNRPRAYCLDFGVTDKGETLLIEMNDGFSIGHYGLPPVQYARMLSARWNELASNSRK